MPDLNRAFRGSLVLVVLLLAGAGVGLWALARRQAVLPGLKVTGTIEATQVEIGSKTTARIREIPVDEGDAVQRGDLLLVLDDDELQAEILRLEAAVGLAQAQLRDLRAGARKEEVAVARAEVARAEAQLADLLAGARREEIEAARQAVAQAEARVRDLLAGARREELEAARQAAAQVEARVRDLEAGARRQEIEQARSELAAAQARRMIAEREYQRFQSLFGQGLVAAQDRDRAWQASEVARREEEAARERLDLAQAGPRPDQVEGARAEARQARDRLALLEAGSRPDQVDAARAEARQARERLRLLEAGPRPHQVEAAQAEVKAVRDRLALLEAGPRPHQVEAAQAQVAQAEAAVAQGRARLADTRMEAPIDGVVLRKNLEPGATATPGTPVLTMVDPGTLWLRAYIPEVDLGRVRVGQSARVTVDAFPGEPFAARLSEIASEAEFTPRNVQTQKERVNLVFRVKIAVENRGGRLKPGMPADAVIVAD